jgi:Skp family chaperone for outer membrane proteins
VAAASIILILAFVFMPSSRAATPPQGDDQTPQKTTTSKSTHSSKSSGSSELQQLKDAIAAQQQQIEQMQKEIDSRDAALRQVKQETDQNAAAAKEAAASAQQAAAAANKANEYDTQDASAMGSLHTSVVDLESATKANTEGLDQAKKSLVKLEKPYQIPAPPTIVPAIAPIRVLSLDPAKKEGLTPGIMLGGVTVTPYGFIKATAAYDSLDPTGDDFPRPAFTAADTGPNNNPEFHLKARSTRFGSRFEWPDASSNIVVTGQIEADFEGNFSAVDNRNVSSIRSNAVQLRLAYGRIDWNVKPNTDIFFEGGQDWTIFGSSALMNLFETTFYGAYWGNLYERSPQFRLGLVEKLGGSRNWRLSPEFAIMMPSEGNLPANAVTCSATNITEATSCTVVNGLASQIGYGERQGADWGKPELESRVVLQFQLDPAPGVVPAQVLWSGFYTGRQATVLASAIPLDTANITNPDFYRTSFPRGYDATSNGYGNQLAVSLPTRWFTVVASGYQGADLRFFFGGETLSNYNQAGGLIATADGFSVDRSSTVIFGTNAAGQAVAAPQLPVRGYGGFVQVGLPLSRWFKADPKGRNAGWQAYFEYGIDAANANDFRLAKGVSATEGAGPIKDTLKGVTIFYKMNPWVQFGFEEGKYQGFALPDTKGVCTTKVAGLPTCTSTDWRSEFGPIFTF